MIPFRNRYLLLFALLVAASGCGIYKFQDITIPPEVKTVRVNFIENRAAYINPQLSPTLTDRLKQKIVNQTRLSQTNKDNADYDISATITDYSVTTSGVSTTNGKSQSSVNRLMVGVHIILVDHTKPDEPPREFNVSRSFDFSANQSLQRAEAELLDEMVRNLSDEIFNNIFSGW
jgi:lipopolysaccharide assembly LptE-like protein